MGRPKGFKVVENPKDKSLKFRCDNDTIKKIEYVSNQTGATKSEVIRKGIEIQYNELKK